MGLLLTTSGNAKALLAMAVMEQAVPDRERALFTSASTLAFLPCTEMAAEH